MTGGQVGGEDPDIVDGGRRARGRRLVVLVAAVVAAVVVAFVVATQTDALRNDPPEVAGTDIGRHLQALQRIADENGGTRASGTPGYVASRDYVVEQLRAAGYDPRLQELRFPFYEQGAPAELSRVSPSPRSFDNGTEFTDVAYSGAGDVTGRAVPVDTGLSATTTSTSGCESADFADLPDGAIALVQDGGCPLGEKAANAEQAGAAGAVIFDAGGGSRPSGSLRPDPGSEMVSIPVVIASLPTANELAGNQVRIVTSTESGMRTTWNVLADTPAGDPDNVVVVGGHLDSVTPGPGIDDNGTGVAAMLDLAKRLGHDDSLTNKVRFAFWGAEERGVVGSAHYVEDLRQNHPEQWQAIAAYLNLDMIGSPNYVRLVYDGDNSQFPAGPGVMQAPPGSAALEQLFRDYFSSRSQESGETPLSGRSDYAPFVADGVPSGGLATGADGLKTEQEAATYGGEAGAPYDACYHRSCDDLSNVSMQAVDEMSAALRHVVRSLAESTEPVNGGAKGHASP